MAIAGNGKWLPLLAIAASCVLSATGVAGAAEKFRYDFQGASGICQPSMAAYGEKLNPRVLRLENQGESTAFVACAFRGDPTAGGRGAWQVSVNVGNLGTAIRQVSCTFVNGRQVGGDSNAVYRTKTFNVAPRTQGVAFTWEPSEIAGAPESIDRPAVMCSLPKGVALHYISTYYDEDVGS